VDRPGAAEGRQREGARVEAALDRHHLQRTGHVVIDEVADAAGRRQGVDPQRAGDMGLYRGLGCLAVKRNLAIEQMRRDAAQHKVGVGDGRARPALAIGRRAGVSTGALRPDTNGAVVCDTGNRAATGTDGMDVDDRQCQRVVADPAGRGGRGLAVTDQGHIGAGAPHVDGQDIVVPGEAAQMRHASRPSGRAG
jgi:hypothetical protein